MIYDKEIDIAARAQALSKHLNETAYFQLRSIEDFKDGARWAINEFLKNLWHPASEVPEIERVIIMENYYPDGRIEFPSHWRKSTSHNPIDGNTQQWLYIDDLFPKEGGEQ
jgi:hypothetical protein